MLHMSTASAPLLGEDVEGPAVCDAVASGKSSQLRLHLQRLTVLYSYPIRGTSAQSLHSGDKVRARFGNALVWTLVVAARAVRTRRRYLRHAGRMVVRPQPFNTKHASHDRFSISLERRLRLIRTWMTTRSTTQEE